MFGLIFEVISARWLIAHLDLMGRIVVAFMRLRVAREDVNLSRFLLSSDA